MVNIPKNPKGMIIFLLKTYQKGLSPFLGHQCRFYPSCSEYSIQAFNTHGFIRGVFLSINRLLRCQPLSKGGYDPVPKKNEIKISFKQGFFCG